MVLTTAPFLGRVPVSRLRRRIYSSMSTPIWLPVSSTNLPSLSRTATPILSASGSVPMTMSLPISSASATPMERVSASSGLGTRTVENSVSGRACSGTTAGTMPIFASTLVTGMYPVPCTGV